MFSNIEWVVLQHFIVARPPGVGVKLVLTSLHVTRRKLQTPGNAEEHKRQETHKLTCTFTNLHCCHDMVVTGQIQQDDH